MGNPIEELSAEIGNEPWLTAIGQSHQSPTMEHIILYVTDKKAKKVVELKENGYKGFPVIIKKMGRPHLL